MGVNYKFIEALELLQYPELRLKEVLQKFYVPGEDVNAIL
jgi:hypothetical protein